MQRISGSYFDKFAQLDVIKIVRSDPRILGTPAEKCAESYNEIRDVVSQTQVCTGRL